MACAALKAGGQLTPHCSGLIVSRSRSFLFAAELDIVRRAMKPGLARTVVRVVVVAYFIVAGSWLAFVVLAPPLDNVLGIRSGSDLVSFRTLLVAGSPVEAVLGARAGPCSWHAAHDEFLSATVVTCTPPGGASLSWEVSHTPPRPDLPSASLYFTPLNRAAAAALPELLPSSVRPEALPLSRYASGVVYDLARMGALRSNR